MNHRRIYAFIIIFIYAALTRGADSQRQQLRISHAASLKVATQ